jgi:hypothetical protein
MIKEKRTGGGAYRVLYNWPRVTIAMARYAEHRINKAPTSPR